jgi:hypothetical protein
MLQVVFCQKGGGQINATIFRPGMIISALRKDEISLAMREPGRMPVIYIFIA